MLRQKNENNYKYIHSIFLERLSKLRSWYFTCKCGGLLQQLYWKNDALKATKAPFMLTTNVIATAPRNEPKNKFHDTCLSPDRISGKISQNIRMLVMMVKIQNTKNIWICRVTREVKFYCFYRVKSALQLKLLSIDVHVLNVLNIKMRKIAWNILI